MALSRGPLSPTPAPGAWGLQRPPPPPKKEHLFPTSQGSRVPRHNRKTEQGLWVCVLCGSTLTHRWHCWWCWWRLRQRDASTNELCGGGGGSDVGRTNRCLSQANIGREEGGGGGWVGLGQGIIRTSGTTGVALPCASQLVRPVHGCPVPRPTGLMTAPVPRGGTRGRGMPPCPCVWGARAACVCGARAGGAARHVGSHGSAAPGPGPDLSVMLRGGGGLWAGRDPPRWAPGGGGGG